MPNSTPTFVKADGEELALEPLSTERALLAVDIFERLLGELSRYQDEAAAWARRVGEERAVEFTKAEADEHGVGAGHDWTTGPLRLPQPPTQAELVAYIFPSIYRELRPEVTRLAALFLVGNGALEDLWAQHGADGYEEAVAAAAAELETEVRFRWRIGDVARLIVTVLSAERGPILEALGEGRALAAGAPAASAANGSSAPSSRSTARASSTASRKRTAGRRQ